MLHFLGLTVTSDRRVPWVCLVRGLLITHDLQWLLLLLLLRGLRETYEMFHTAVSVCRCESCRLDPDLLRQRDTTYRGSRIILNPG